MSGYPTQGGYGGQQGGYPGAPPPQQGGYPGAPSGGYPGAPPPQQGGYGQRPGAPPSQGGYGGYSGAPSGGYPGAPPQQQQGGYAQRPGAPPPQQGGGPYGSAPPGVDPQTQQWFNAVDQDRSGQISAQELQKALVNGNWSNFSEEACRLMIEMFDRENKGTINIHEFQGLFNYINQWKGTFESFDRDRSGYIEHSELSQAFQQMGYRFSPTFVQNLLAKYDPKTKRLTLDNFIVCCVQIKRLTDSFRTRDREMKGAATLQYEDFIGIALGAHK